MVPADLKIFGVPSEDCNTFEARYMCRRVTAPIILGGCNGDLSARHGVAKFAEIPAAIHELAFGKCTLCMYPG